jgi:putative Holliday junction resolvase
MRMLGLDLGDRRVGVAVSDPDGIIAQPLVQLEPRGRRDLVAAVARLVAQEGAGRVVVGMPLLADGTRGEQARRVEATVAALRQALEVPVVVWDERYSTQDAERALRAAGRRGTRRQGRLDMAAAAVILQAYLESGAPLSPPGPAAEARRPAPPTRGRPGSGT